MNNTKSNSEALISAVKEGNHENLVGLLKQMNSDDTTNTLLALVYAIKAKDITSVKLLLDFGCLVNHRLQSDLFYQPINYAVSTGNLEIIKLLLKYDVSMLTNSSAKTALYKAMKEQQFHIVDLMLSVYKVDTIDPTNKQEFLHFNIACARDNANLVLQFIKKGINVNAVLDDYADDWAGYKPLHLSVIFLSVNTVEILLRHNADFTFKDKRGVNLPTIVYSIWQNKNESSDRKEKAKKIIEMIFNAHIRNVISSPLPMNPLDTGSKILLPIAVKFNHLNFVKFCLNRGVDSDCTDSNGHTLLHLAIENKFYDMTELILQFKINIQSENNKYYELIFQAFLDYPKTDKIIDMIFLTCKKHIRNVKNEGLSLLHIACLRKNISIIKKLLITSNIDAPSGLIDSKNSKWNGYTPLHVAASVPNLEAVHTLLKHNANPNTIAAKGLTPLWLSINNQPSCYDIENIIAEKFANVQEEFDEGQIFNLVSQKLKHIQVVELLAKNSNVNHRNDAGEHLLFSTFQSLANNFIDKGSQEDAVISKVCKKYLQKSAGKIISCLIKRSIDINFCDAQKTHILHNVIYGLKNEQCFDLVMEVLEILLENKADVNAKNLNGNTPLHIAVQYGFVEVIELLLNYKADINSTNNNLATPLHTAAAFCSDCMVKLTPSAKARGMPYAVSREISNYKSKNRSIFECLLKHNCNVNARDIKGKTPLAALITTPGKDANCVQLLLDFGSDIKIKDIENKTVLDLMYKEYRLLKFPNNYCLNVVEVLLRHALKLMVIGQSGELHNALLYDFKFYSGRNQFSYTTILREELEKLKIEKIDDYFSLYDLLHKNKGQLAKLEKNKVLERYVSSETLCAKFPNYGNILRLKFNEV